jgi:hypothetical protein
MRVLSLALSAHAEQTLRTRVADAIHGWLNSWCASKIQPTLVLELLTQAEFDIQIKPAPSTAIDDAGKSVNAWHCHVRAKSVSPIGDTGKSVSPIGDTGKSVSPIGDTGKSDPAFALWIHSATTDTSTSTPALMEVIFGASSVFGFAHHQFEKLAIRAERALVEQIATALSIQPAHDISGASQVSVDELFCQGKTHAAWHDPRLANLRYRVRLGTAELILHLNALAVEALIQRPPRARTTTKLATRASALANTALSLDARVTLRGLRLDDLHAAKPGDVLLSHTAFGEGLAIWINRHRTDLKALPSIANSNRAVSLI